MSTRTVSAVIVTFNSAPCIEACLTHLLASAHADLALEIIVIDNASRDDTLSLLIKWNTEIRLIQNSRNRGFAAACNQGIRTASGDYVLLLNPDAYLGEGCLATMINYLERNAKVAIVGPRLVDEQGRLPPNSSVTALLPGFWQALCEYTMLRHTMLGRAVNQRYFLSRWDRKTTRRVAMVQGACFLFTSELTASIGLLDERFFLYFEETDFCARARKIKKEIHYISDARCRHTGGHSALADTNSKKYFTRSLYKYHKKQIGILPSIALRIIVIFSYSIEIFILKLFNFLKIKKIKTKYINDIKYNFYLHLTQY